MNKMLLQDSELFESRFHEASNFLVAAQLRYEFFALSLRVRNGIGTTWEKERLKELKKCPACSEPWFVRRIENEMKGIWS